MISSKFCIEFFFRYNSKVLITPIPQINFEEFQLLLNQYPRKNSSPLQIRDKTQDVIIICLENFSFFLEEILQGNYQISEVLQALIHQFTSFIDIEFHAIFLYNEAKLHLFKEIDYLLLSYKRILNFLQDLDQYIVKVLKKQALIDLFYKAFAKYFQEIQGLEPFLEKDDDNYHVFLKIKGFLSEKLIDINELWAVDSNRKLINEKFSENLLSGGSDEPPNKYEKNSSFKASKNKKNKTKDFPRKIQNENENYNRNFSNFNEKYKSSQSSASQIEIEFKNMISPEETPIKSGRSPFDDTFLPLKDSIWDNSHSFSQDKSFMKHQTKSLAFNVIEERSILFKRKSFMTINANNNNDFLDPKNSFRRNLMENSKYQVKTKEKQGTLSKMPVHIQVNGVIFMDPLYLLEQANTKEDFSLFKDFLDEDIDESDEPYVDQSPYNLKTLSMMESKCIIKSFEEVPKQETSASIKRKSKKKLTSKVQPKPHKSSSRVDKLMNSNDGIIIHETSQKTLTDINHSFNSVQRENTMSNININQMLQYESSSEEKEEELTASPLVRRQNFLKSTFIGVRPKKQKKLTVCMNSFEIPDSETMNLDIMIAEPEILKAISLSCGISNNHSSVIFSSKRIFSKKGEWRKKLANEKAKSKKRWAFLRRIVKDYMIAKRKFVIVKNFNEFIDGKLYKDLGFLTAIIRIQGILLGKGSKQGQGEGGLDSEMGEFIYAVNREVKKFGRGGFVMENNQFLF